MAITVDQLIAAEAFTMAAGGTKTYSHSNATAPTAVIVVTRTASSGARPSGITYGGTALTLSEAHQFDAGTSPYVRYVYCDVWTSLAPASGVQDVVVSAAAGSIILISVTSFIGTVSSLAVTTEQGYGSGPSIPATHTSSQTVWADNLFSLVDMQTAVSFVSGGTEQSSFFRDFGGGYRGEVRTAYQTETDSGDLVYSSSNFLMGPYPVNYGAALVTLTANPPARKKLPFKVAAA